MTAEWMNVVRGWFKKGERYRLLVALGLGGIVLIGLSAFLARDERAQTGESVNTTAVYAAALEKRLAEMVSSIDGAGRATVMVTLENGVEYVYANEEKTNNDHSENGAQISVRDDSQKTVVTVDDGSGKKGLLVTEIQPTVRGVVVTCEGATNDAVAARVMLAVRTALNITEKRVCVIPYTSEKGI